MIPLPSVLRPRSWTALAALLVAVAACGGGGSDPTPAPTPPAPVTPAATPLPAVLAAEVPALVEAGAAVALKTALPATATDLRYDWDFGDGQRSTEPQPAHAWAAPGRYDWRLTVRNGDGTTASAAGTVQAGAFARLAGESCTGGTSLGGWCRLVDPLSAYARDVHCADGLNCVAVGESSQVAYTRDGGRSWALTRVPVAGQTLARVRMADADTVYAFDFDGESVWRSRDGGRTWLLAAQFAAGAGVLRNGAGFFGPGYAWTLGTETVVAGSNGSRISRDAGATWTELPFQTLDVTPNGFLWENGNQRFSPDQGATVRTLPPVGFAIAKLAEDATTLRVLVDGGAGTPGRYVLLSSSDGGRSFTQRPVQLPTLTAGSFLGEVVLRADGSGDARALTPGQSCGDSPQTARWLRTADGGLTWTEDASLVSAGRCLADLRLTTDRRAYVVTTGDSTPDGMAAGSGMAVDLLELDTKRRSQWALSNVSGLNIDRQAGRVLLLKNDLSRWVASAPDQATTATLLPLVEPAMLRAAKVIVDIFFFNASDGLMVATTGGPLQTTGNGGRSWSTLSPSAPRGGHDFILPPGDAPLLLINDSINRSSDRGRTWSTLAKPWPGSAVFFLDAQRGWTTSCAPVAVFYSCDARLERTVDGGSRWVTVGPLPEEPLIGGLAFVNDRDGVLKGKGGALWSTADGGLSWSRSVAVDGRGQRSELQGLGPVRTGANGLVWTPAVFDGRQVILRSEDGARTWQPVDLGLGSLPDTGALRVTDLFNLDDRHLWAVGSRGLIVASSDGGRSWRVQDSGTVRNLSTVFALDPSTVWAGGEFVLLTTSTGGR